MQHMEMEAPFVFHGDAAEQDYEYQIARLRLTEGPMFADREVLPPPEAPAAVPASTSEAKAAKPPAKKGFMAKMKSFFGTIFK